MIKTMKTSLLLCFSLIVCIALLHADPPTNSPAAKRLAERRLQAARTNVPSPGLLTTSARTNAPAQLGPVYTINLREDGVSVTVRASRKFSVAELRHWLREAALKRP